MSKPEISRPPFTSPVLRYGLAFLCVAVAVGLGLLGRTYSVKTPEFSFFLLAIAITVWFAGNGPGALAVILSSLVFNLHRAALHFRHQHG